jgi:hypothetical protein
MTTVQDMQMCLLCSPGFERGSKAVLAHDIGLHVFVHKDSFTTTNGDTRTFLSHSLGNEKYIYQQRAKHKEYRL